MEFRYEDERIYQTDGEGRLLAEVTFPQLTPGEYCIDHTFVDPALRGQGMADKLVRAAVDEIGRRGGRVRATCSYAAAWLARHGEKDTEP